MYFTPEGLEQATRLPGRRRTVPRGCRAAASELIDLGCGIGGDLVAFSRAGMTCAGVDVDPVRVEVAPANLDALGLAGAVMVADATTVDTSPFAVAFADPARRSAGGRELRRRRAGPRRGRSSRGCCGGDACVKAAPGIPHDLVPHGVEAEWVSDQGEVKEVALWSGRLATTRRRATVIGHGGLATITDEDDPGAAVRDVGAFLYEPEGR